MPEEAPVTRTVSFINIAGGAGVSPGSFRPKPTGGSETHGRYARAATDHRLPHPKREVIGQ